MALKINFFTVEDPEVGPEREDSKVWALRQYKQFQFTIMSGIYTPGWDFEFWYCRGLL